MSILLGLKLAISLGIPKLIAEVDSQAAISLFQKGAPSLNFGDTLISQIQKLLMYFQHVKILYNFRETNSCVDCLVNWVIPHVMRMTP